MLQTIAALGLALTMSLPNLAAKTGNFLFPDFSAQSQADDSLRECLILTRSNYQIQLETARKNFNDAVALARADHKNAIDKAWQARETAIKSGRVKIAAYDDSGRQRENKKAERSVFELTKSDAETAYEAAKKDASAAWKASYRSASQAWENSQQELKAGLLGGKNECVRLNK